MRYHLRACAALCAVLAAACGDSPTGPSTASVYVLTSVNDLAVPAARDGRLLEFEYRTGHLDVPICT